MLVKASGIWKSINDYDINNVNKENKVISRQTETFKQIQQKDI